MSNEAALHDIAAEHVRQERSGGMSDHELDSLGDRIWTRLESKFESLGWDVSTPTSRDRIRANNKWVDDWRDSAEKAKTVATNAGILAFISGALVLAWQAFKTLIARAE